MGKDTIFGGKGADYIDASGLIGAELFGGQGNDLFALGPAENAMIHGGSGTDAVDVVPDQAFRLDARVDDEIGFFFFFLLLKQQQFELAMPSSWLV